MNKAVHRFREMRVGTKLSLISFALISLVFGLFVWGVSFTTSNLLEQRAKDDMSAQTKAVISMLDVFNADLKREAGRSVKILEGYFPGRFSLDAATKIEVAGKSTPALKNGGNVVNNDNSTPDRFSSRSGVPATVFVKSGDDFIRVATSLKNAAGERAIGTALDRTHPSYQRLLSGDAYAGVATLFNRKYFTQYAPIKDDKGQVIGALFIGIDFTDECTASKARINALKVGDTGHFTY